MAAAAAPMQPSMSAPSASAAPEAPQPTQPPPQQAPPGEVGGGAADVDRARSQRDYTQVPQELDARFERLDQDNCLRPTIVKPGKTWSKREKKKLLADFTSRSLSADDQT